MANSAVFQILEDGSKFTVVKGDISLDSSNLANTVVVDPAVQYVDPIGNATTQYRIDHITFSIQAPLALDFLWDATTPVSIVRVAATGQYPMFDDMQPLQNNAGAGKTGKILVASFGWTAGTLVASFVMRLVKQ
jgi:hypothetical protein